eukprot:1160032-Pelagomonas_calceolata.AAC.1
MDAAADGCCMGEARPEVKWTPLMYKDSARRAVTAQGTMLFSRDGTLPLLKILRYHASIGVSTPIFEKITSGARKHCFWE